jgi:hypothetical protein
MKMTQLELGCDAVCCGTIVAPKIWISVETKGIVQNSIDANDDLASCKEGVTDAKPGLVSIA